MTARGGVLRSFAMKKLAFLILGLTLLGSVRAAFAVDILDTGTFEVYQDDRALGTETFAFERHSDSLFIHCQVRQEIPSPNGTLSLEKSMRLLTKEFDGALVLYESVQTVNEQRLVRAIVPTDTAMTVYREDDRAGEGRTIVRPPGKIYIIDPQLFTLFDIICREFGSREFDERRIRLFVLAAEDTTVDALVTDMGTETIRWGAKPVQARKLRIGDTTSEFFAMVGPQGYMLQLLQPSTGLRVVRKARDVKPPGSR
jgi:hypothetical protein